MKTAMQELVDELRSFAFDKKLHLGMGDIFLTQGHIDDLEEKYIEKEKQRMFHCFNAGADAVSERRFNEWFNKTYNQNK
jgi:hypothetical protein